MFWLEQYKEWMVLNDFSKTKVKGALKIYLVEAIVYAYIM